MKFAILATYALIPYIEPMLPELEKTEHLSLDLFDYGRLSNLRTFYPSIRDKYDGVILSGFAAMTALKRYFPDDDKPVISFDTSLEEIYYALLKLLDQNRNINLENVVVDIYLQIYPEHNCKRLLEITDMETTKNKSAQFWKDITLEELDTLEDRLLSRLLAKKEQGELDYVIARNASIIPKLQDAHIPYTFLYPARHQLENTIRSLSQYISIRQNNHYMAAAIIVVREGQSNAASDILDENDLALQQALLAFKKEHTLDLQFQKLQDGFLIFTNLRTVERLTNNLKHCILSSYLEQHLTFETHVAYGIAQELSDARHNALTALRESRYQKAPFALFKDKLIGPLTADAAPFQRVTDDRTILQAAEKSSLSPATLQKIKLILNDRDSNEITAAELSEKLNVKIRNTNRILQALVQAELAEATGLQATGTRGRPTRVYKIHL